jgi:putative transposase
LSTGYPTSFTAYPGRSPERLFPKPMTTGTSSPVLNIWNKLRPEEEAKVLAQARDSPALSCRQFALRLVDSGSFYISESTVFRILKREGLIKPAEITGFKAGREYQRKTTKPNELWATDCAHLRVVDWGWYYLVTVMDDFSRFILALGVED